MKKPDNAVPTHSFLFWLVIPVTVVWLAVNYVRAEVDENVSVSSREGANSANRIAVVTREYPDLPENRSGYISLWFDDAWLSQYITAAPILRQYGYLGTMAVPTKAVETNGYVNWAQIQTLQKEGWEITNHSQTHSCEMQDWTEAEIREEFINSSIDLWSRGLTSDIFVSPCGVNSPVLEKSAKLHFTAFRGVGPGINDLNNLNLNELKVKNIDRDTSIDELRNLLDLTKQNKSWLIIVFHKIGEQGQSDEDETYNIKLEDFEALMEEIRLREIDVVTASQIIKNQ